MYLWPFLSLCVLLFSIDGRVGSTGKIAAMLKKHNAVFLFTCMEKEDKDEPPEALCSPQSLVHETARAAALNG